MQAKGQDNAQGPSDEHLWAPVGKQEQVKCPSAHKCDISTPNPCLMWLQQNLAPNQIGPQINTVTTPTVARKDRSLAKKPRWSSPSRITPVNSHCACTRLTYREKKIMRTDNFF